MSTEEPPDPDDPIAYYIDHLDRVGRSPSSIKGADYALGKLSAFLNHRDLEPEQLTHRVCIEFIATLEESLSSSTVHVIITRVGQFYQFFSDRGTFETNPVATATQEVAVSQNDDHQRKEIDLMEMRSFIQDIKNPQIFAMVTLLAKSGIRVGELVNLDLTDVHIDHPRSNRVLPPPRPGVDDKPDSIFIDSSIAEGDVIRGDKRIEGNKRKRTTIIPLDDELKQTLLYWLAARPASKANGSPLFMGTKSRRRLNSNSAGMTIARIAKTYGWYTTGAGVQNNVTPHYFRHWFTTTADRNGMDRAVLKYIRGDVGNDVVDSTYRHMWGSEVRDEYTRKIFELFPS